MKTLIVLPSYNERDNILSLIDEILGSDPRFHVCVVDDSSPDGTAALLNAAKEQDRDSRYSRMHLLVRPGKGGRGGAVREGFMWGLGQPGHFDVFVEMDCDFSHEPRAIFTGIRLLEGGVPVAMGVRYPNGTIIGWPVGRRVFSFFANTMARCLIDWSVPDYTNGFRFYTREAASFLVKKPQKNTGYIYLSETASYLLRGGYRVAVFPIVFRNRVRGVSNTTFREISNAFRGLLRIAWEHRFSRP